MGEDLAIATAQPVKFVLAGEDWLVSPLTMGDLSAFQASLRDRKRKSLTEMLVGASVPDRIAANERLCRDGVSDEEMQAAMATFEGFQFILWRCLRKRKPDLTLEAVGDMFTMTDMKELLPVVQAISGLDPNENPMESSLPVIP